MGLAKVISLHTRISQGRFNLSAYRNAGLALGTSLDRMIGVR